MSDMFEECDECDRFTTRRGGCFEWRTAAERDAGVCLTCWLRCECGTATPNEDGICVSCSVSCPQQCAYKYYDVDRRTNERRLHSCGRQAVAGGVWPNACSLRTHCEQVDQIRYFRAQCNKCPRDMYGYMCEASHTATLRRPAPGAYARTT